MGLRGLFTAIYLILFLTACQLAPVDFIAQETKESPGPVLEEISPQPFVAIKPVASITQEAPGDLWVRIREDLTWQELSNAEIAKARTWYLRQSSFLPTVSNRANYYLHYIVEEVEKRDMPMEIALLPLVESNLNPFAKSPSHAGGIWQIMPATGRSLGLNQDWWFDGRQDLRASTRAALDYLEQLNKRNDGDWLLTLAAYNAGNGRVNRAQRANSNKGLPTDYWSLKLPRETKGYVPKLIALAQIIATPEKYSANLPYVANAPAFEVASTDGQIEIARAAELAGIDIGTLRAFNPGQLRWATAPGSGELLVPVGSGKTFEERFAQLDPARRVEWQRYKIQRGDSLSRIAHKFDSQVSLLKEVNKLKGSRIRAGDTLMIPKGNAWASSLAFSGKKQPSRQGYRVRNGDSLYRIAGKFNVSVRDIISWNALDPNKYLQPGQKLTLYVTGG
jgi:peptidoglycan lytic transglycosylase D